MIATTGAGELTRSFGGFSPGSIVTFGVSARDAAGNESPRTTARVAVPSPLRSVPDAPLALAASATTRTVTAIRVAEELGNVVPVIQQEAQLLRRREESRLEGRFSAAGMAFYLCCVLCVMQVIVGFLMYWIMPKFKKIIHDLGIPVPESTSRLIGVSDYFGDHAGLIALWRAVEDPSRAARAAAVLTLVGAINLPIIKFSVDWWNTLHQPSSVLRMGGPALDRAFLIPLLVMAGAFSLLFLTLHLAAMRNEILRRRVRSLQMMQASRRSA